MDEIVDGLLLLFEDGFQITDLWSILTHIMSHAEDLKEAGADKKAFVLEALENVLDRAVVFLGPQVRVVFGIDELCRNPKPVTRLPYRAFEDILHVEFTADGPRVLIGSLELDGRVAGDHAQ